MFTADALDNVKQSLLSCVHERDKVLLQLSGNQHPLARQAVKEIHWQKHVLSLDFEMAEELATANIIRAEQIINKLESDCKALAKGGQVIKGLVDRLNELD